LSRFKGNFVAFAENATDDNRMIFGSDEKSDEIDDNFNDDFKIGWEIVGEDDNPTRQDFNALGFTISKLIGYLYTAGIAEWDNEQKYIIGDFCKIDNVIYSSLSGEVGDENIGNDPTQSDDFWVDINEESSASLANAILENRQDIEKLKLGVES